MDKSPKETAKELYLEIIKIFETSNNLPCQPFVSAQKIAELCCDKLLAERNRAIETAYQFMYDNRRKFESKKKAGNNLAFVNDNIAEECRYIGNAISGKNALSFALNEKEYWMQVKEEIKNM